MQWILGLHSLLRWLILIFLVINIIRSLVEADASYTPDDIKWNLRLLIVSHLTLLLGFIQYFFGRVGFVYFKDNSFSAIMKDHVMRFWAVEHITGMIIAVAIITISRGITKKNDMPDSKKHKRQLLLYSLALVIILASIPWPFRIADTPWFRGL